MKSNLFFCLFTFFLLTESPLSFGVGEPLPANDKDKDTHNNDGAQRPDKNTTPLTTTSNDPSRTGTQKTQSATSIWDDSESEKKTRGEAKLSPLENKHQDSDNPASNSHIPDDAMLLGARRKIPTAPSVSRGISSEKKIKKIQAAIASSTEDAAQQVSQSLSSLKARAHSASQHGTAEFKTFLSCAVEQYILNQTGETFISDFDAQAKHIKNEAERKAARQQAKLHAADRISSHANLTELHLADTVNGLAAIHMYIRLNHFEKAVEDGKRTKSYLKIPPQINTLEPSYVELVSLPPNEHATNIGSVIRHDSNKVVMPSASISSGDAEDQTTYTENELFELLMTSSGLENYSELKYLETHDRKEEEKINFILSIIPTPDSTNHNPQKTRAFCHWVDAESQQAKQKFLDLCKLHRSLQHLLSRNKQTQDSLSLSPT